MSACRKSIKQEKSWLRTATYAPKKNDQRNYGSYLKCTEPWIRVLLNRMHWIAVPCSAIITSPAFIYTDCGTFLKHLLITIWASILTVFHFPHVAPQVCADDKPSAFLVVDKFPARLRQSHDKAYYDLCHDDWLKDPIGSWNSNTIWSG